MPNKQNSETNEQALVSVDNDFLAQFGMGALDDLSMSDVIMPRYRLIQHTSKKGTPGKWASNVSEEEFDALEVAILSVSKFRVYFNEDPSAGDKPLCKSNDSKTKADASGCGDGVCANCRFSQWKKDATGASIKPPCGEGYTLICAVLQSDGTFVPGFISLRGAAIKPLKQYFTTMKSRGGVPSFAYLTKLSTITEVGNKGRYFRANFEMCKDLLPKQTILELASQAKQMSHLVGSEIAAGDVRDDDGGISGPTSSGAQDFLNNQANVIEADKTSDFTF